MAYNLTKPILKCTFPEFRCLPGEVHSQWGEKSKPFKKRIQKEAVFKRNDGTRKAEAWVGKRILIKSRLSLNCAFAHLVLFLYHSTGPS